MKGHKYILPLLTGQTQPAKINKLGVPSPVTCPRPPSAIISDSWAECNVTSGSNSSPNAA